MGKIIKGMSIVRKTCLGLSSGTVERVGEMRNSQRTEENHSGVPIVCYSTFLTSREHVL